MFQETAAELAAVGESVYTPDPDGFTRGLVRSLEARVEANPAALAAIQTGEVTLGFLGRSHIGDVLCISSILEPLRKAHGIDVYTVRHRSTRTLLESDRHLAGFRNKNRLDLRPLLLGTGHVIQRLHRAFGLTVPVYPRPSITLSTHELEWALEVARRASAGGPLAVLSTGSLTDRCHFQDRASLPRWLGPLTNNYTVVQPLVTRPETLTDVLAMQPDHIEQWRPDTPLPGCLHIRDLPLRLYLALVSVTDLYVGPNSAGAHAAAAFDIPALVLLPRSGYPVVPELPDLWTDPQENSRHESYLYPQHGFLHVS